MRSITVLLLTATFTTILAINGCKEKQETTAAGVQPATEDSLFKKYELDKITLPAGFHISVYAEVPNARSMALSPNGTLFVGNRDGDKVFAVRDENKDGHADSVYTIASGLNTPNGVAFRDGSLYVAEINRILRFDNIEHNLINPPAYQVVYDNACQQARIHRCAGS